MSWWPFSSDPRGEAIRAGTAIPNRAERAVCWTSRDAFFACLDAHDVVDTTREPGAAAASRACPAQERAFERDCAAEWTRYFRRWRVADVQKRRRLDELRARGATEMTVTSDFAPEGAGAGAGGAGAGKTPGDIQHMVEQSKR